MEVENANPKPKIAGSNGTFDNVWKVSVRPNGEKKFNYFVKITEMHFTDPVVEGILAEMVTGAQALQKKRANDEARASERVSE